EGLLLLYIHKKEERSKDAFSISANQYLGRIPKVLGLEILFSLMLFVGFLLFVIPGVFMLIVFGFAYYFVVLENKGIYKAFLLSRTVTKGNRLNILLAGILSILATMPFDFIFKKLPVSLH